MPVLSPDTICRRAVLVLLGEHGNSYPLTLHARLGQHHGGGLAELPAKTA